MHRAWVTAVVACALLALVASQAPADVSAPTAKMEKLKNQLFQVVTAELSDCHEITTSDGLARCEATLDEYVRVVEMLKLVFKQQKQKPL